ncbi:MAG: HIT domain-containing protein [Chlamydiales bacterium]
MKSIFEKIIDRELPAEILFENDSVIAIQDIHPLAPIHILIISKQKYPDFQNIPTHDMPIILGEIGVVAQLLAKKFSIESGYRLVTNIGASSGQTIYHLHFHLLGGKQLGHMG